ncbi:Cytochrome c family protein [hydrothermal vent metagenome]|uniref:Cytochrome c family protein n=1 Tax=hydrothermal vent metagenome TaxID=652676 RepID=A0A3B0YIT1_9ZZZZ
MKRVVLVISLLLLPSLSRAGDIQQLLQLIDYVGADYGEAVSDGSVTNAGEFEEMQDFSQGIVQQIGDLPEGKTQTELIVLGARLAEHVSAMSEPRAIRVLTAEMRQAIIDGYKVTVVPRQAPDPLRATQLYSENCASCHGASGAGDGPLAKGMQPPPIDFTDRERYAQRNLYGLYNTITQGVPDTPMSSFHEMSADDRWSLAFYVGQLAVTEAERSGSVSDFSGRKLAPLQDIRKLTVLTPAEAEQQFGPEGGQLMAYLRTSPDALFSNRSPLEYSMHRLDDVVAAYRAGDADEAYRMAVEAYLEGFELVEQGLSAVDGELRLEVEHAMTTLRSQIRKDISVEQLEAAVIDIKGMLETAGQRLSGRSLSGTAAFASAFFILLREGLEALLVIAALAAFLVKTEHRNNMRYLHYGWIGALAAGFLTWWASVSLVEISGASREITEGVAALTATAVLFYVGFWMHDKTSAAQWRQFIENNVRKALSAGALWGLSGLSFITVYREVFETILFYQALWAQTDEAGRSMALSGFGTAVGVLVVLGWLVMRYSVRLPLRQFFSVTGILMFVLAVIFAGKGVAALQEAGYIPVSPVNFPRFELFGVYPNLQGLALQLGLLLLALFLWYGLPSKRRAAKS